MSVYLQLCGAEPGPQVSGLLSEIKNSHHAQVRKVLAFCGPLSQTLLDGGSQYVEVAEL